MRGKRLTYSSVLRRGIVMSGKIPPPNHEVSPSPAVTCRWWESIELWAVVAVIAWMLLWAENWTDKNRVDRNAGLVCLVATFFFTFPATMALRAMRRDPWWASILSVLILAACPFFNAPVFLWIYTALYLISVAYYFYLRRTEPAKERQPAPRKTLLGSCVIVTAVIGVLTYAYVRMNRIQLIADKDGIHVFDRWTGLEIGTPRHREPPPPMMW